jgi:hypothetical protein
MPLSPEDCATLVDHVRQRLTDSPDHVLNTAFDDVRALTDLSVAERLDVFLQIADSSIRYNDRESVLESLTSIRDSLENGSDLTGATLDLEPGLDLDLTEFLRPRSIQMSEARKAIRILRHELEMTMTMGQTGPEPPDIEPPNEGPPRGPSLL